MAQPIRRDALSKYLLNRTFTWVPGSTARIVQWFCNRLHQPWASSPLAAPWIAAKRLKMLGHL